MDEKSTELSEAEKLIRALEETLEIVQVVVKITEIEIGLNNKEVR